VEDWEGKWEGEFEALQEFLEAGKRRLMGDTQRQATSNQVQELKRENAHLKERSAELMLKNRVLKKSMQGLDEEADVQ